MSPARDPYDRYVPHHGYQPPPPPRHVPDNPPDDHVDLRILRDAYRWQRRVATLTALGYFTLFLILSAYAPGFMTSTVTGHLPTGLLLALLQLPVTWLATALYEHTAHRYVDPIADHIRRQATADTGRDPQRRTRR